ncbi:MAG: EAL domain-containing protein [Methylotenera sp.]|uniref:EAL domain-containing protein n=1 Tax=Methylotenera sp. TaxID=2051956 RepID=UPI0024884B76|nr:EAL domain-containing protein [Methylotenera sp.]MDI1310120.1 EAL domain-containing protein [Methylotenera sp.]
MILRNEYTKLIELNYYKIIINALILVGYLFLYCAKSQAQELIKFQKQIHNLNSTIPLTIIEKQWIKTHDPILVAVKSGWMPIEFQVENQLHRGYAIDYLQEIANLYQINFEIVNYTEDTKHFEADIISSISGQSSNNDKFHLLSQPYLVIPYAIYINKNLSKAFQRNNLEDLRSGKVAIFKKSGLAKSLIRNNPELKLIPVDIADEALDYLKVGSVEAYIGNEFVVDYHIALNQLNFVEKSGLTPFTSTVTMAVKNDQPVLSSIMEKATTLIGQNNPDLMRKWKFEKSNQETILKFAIAVILFTFLIFSIGFYKSKSKAKKELAENQNKIWNQANFDFLTGLPNRHLLQNSLKQTILKAERYKTKVGLLFIDLDDFKQVNDSSGHSTGDSLLKSCAIRITGCLRKCDITARLGGDEFMIIIPDLINTPHIESICQEILSSIQVPFEVEETSYFISASIGVTIYPDDSSDSEELIRYADQAMYAAKANGRNGYSFFTPSMQIDMKARIKLANDLRSALSENQLWIAYQPIIDSKSGKILKAEALIRWQHPEYGAVNPNQFIPIAEHTGLINDIGEFVFQRAVQAVKRWQETYDSEFQISINVSPVQFNDRSKKYRSWHEQLKDLGLLGKSIVVEITEGLLLEANTSTQNKLLEFRDIGVQVALDDFGTGYSALSYLKKFDIDYIKIDQTFVRNLSTSSEDLALCEAIIVMAHKLGLKVIAEGVETHEQRQILTDMDCDYLQGYLMSKPIPINDFEKLLNDV